MVNCAYCKKDSRRNKGLSFHQFPSKKEEKDKWIKVMDRENWTPSKYSALCANHFTPNCIDFRDKLARLRKGSIPTLFGNGEDTCSSLPVVDDISKAMEIEEDNNTNLPSTPPIVQVEKLQEKEEVVRELYNSFSVTLDQKVYGLHHDHTYDLSDEGMKRKLEALEERNRELTKEIKNKRRKEERANRKIRSMRKVIEELTKRKCAKQKKLKEKSEC